MQIKRIDLYKYSVNIPTVHFQNNIAASEKQRFFVVIKISTDRDYAGYSMAGHFVHQNYHSIIEGISRVADFILGKDPWEKQLIWDYLRVMERRGILSIQAFGAIDVALWDLCGKIVDQPIVNLLGRVRDTIPVYASCQKHGTIEEYLQEIKSLQKRGIKIYKLHPIGNLRQDIKLAESIYNEYKGQIQYIFDGTFNYSLSEAIFLGKKLDKFGFLWLEDPLKELKIEAYKHLHKKIITPLALGDLSPEFNSQSIAAYLISACCDIIKPDIAYKGGITGSKLMADITSGFGLNCDIHHAGNPLLNVATLHLACSLNNVNSYEWIIPDELHNYGIIDYPEPDTSGTIKCPSGAGLGVHLDFEVLSKNLIKSINL